MLKTLTLALTLALLAACGGDLAPRDQITDLRVLAIRADPPMVMPGDTLALDALVVHPDGEAISYRWSACALPENFGSYGGGGGDGLLISTCAELPGALQLGSTASASLTIPSDFLTANQDVFDALYSAGLPDEAVQALLAIGGLHMRVNLVVETANGERVDAFKRIVVTPAGVNANPAPPALFVGPRADAASAPTEAVVPTPGDCLLGEPSLATLGIGDWTLTPVNLPAEPEEYPVIDFLGGFETKQETYYMSWFTTVNGLRASRTKTTRPENDLGLSEAFDRGLLQDRVGGGLGLPVWVVVRDGRGGTNWCHSVIPFEENATGE